MAVSRESFTRAEAKRAATAQIGWPSYRQIVPCEDPGDVESIIVQKKYRGMSDAEIYREEEKRLLGQVRVGKTRIAQTRASLNAISPNYKTGRSFECTTLCPKHVKGLACSYCYVNAAGHNCYSCWF